MTYNFDRRQEETKFDQLVRISVDKINGLHSMDWLDIKEEYEFNQSAEQLRKVAKGWQMLKEHEEYKSAADAEGVKYKESTEIMGDGSFKSDKLISMSNKDSKDVNFMLKAHGFNENEWELVNARNSIWNVNNKKEGLKELYSSRITVKPRVNGFNVDRFIEKLKDVKPKFIKQPVNSSERLLAIPFVDLHMGINNISDYQEKLNESLEIIESKKWNTIYFQIGNDGIHVNNHKNQTANGTQIEAVDLDYATEEFYKFYVILLDKALENAENVVADYIPGNHDSDLTWMLVKMLSKMYPQIKWNTKMEAKKMFKWKNIFICGLHGDKGMNRVTKSLITEYRDYMVGAKTIEVYSGHLHSEKVKDEYGIVVRTLPTSAKTDDWHKSMSFEGAKKVSQLFEYDADKLKVIHYV